MEHKTINRSEQWVADGININTMEGFWSFVRHVWYGSHHHYSTKYTAVSCRRLLQYNYRGTNIFAKFLAESIETGKSEIAKVQNDKFR